jgi:light-regulated signal transduction histidine kinase (bacteriophytochrome)
MPRQSFEAWCKLKTGQAQQWAESEFKLAPFLKWALFHCCEAIPTLQTGTNLEQQVRDRTGELQQTKTDLQRSTIKLQRSVERQQALAWYGTTPSYNKPKGDAIAIMNPLKKLN